MTDGALLLLPWNVSVHGAPFGGTFGPLLLILVPFGFMGRAVRRRGVLLAAVAAYLLVWASPLGSFQLRFLIPLVPILAVIAAAGASSLDDATARFGPAARGTMAGTLALLLACNLPPFIEWHERDRRGWTGWLTHVHRALPLAVVLGAESEPVYLSRTVPTYTAWQRIDALTPPDSVVLTFLGGDHLYGTRARLWSDATLATDVTWGALAGDGRAHAGGRRASRPDTRAVRTRTAWRCRVRAAGDRQRAYTPVLPRAALRGCPRRAVSIRGAC